MNYLKLPGMDSEVLKHDICQAYLQLESDYNVGGILRERPSNQRRNASTGVQLSRMKYLDLHRWVNVHDPEDGDEDVADIYLKNVLKWKLPMDEAMKAVIQNRYTPEFLVQYGWVPVEGQPS